MAHDNVAGKSMSSDEAQEVDLHTRARRHSTWVDTMGPDAPPSSYKRRAERIPLSSGASHEQLKSGEHAVRTPQWTITRLCGGTNAHQVGE